MEKKFGKVHAVFLDIDGTISTSEKKVTDYTKDVLRKLKEKGIYVILCSGRANPYVEKMAKSINTSKYIISNNGSYVYNYEEDDEIFVSPLEHKAVEKLWKYSEKEGVEVLINSKDTRYANDKAFVNFSNESIKIKDLGFLKKEETPQMVLKCKKEEQSEEIKRIIKNETEMEITNYGKRYYHKGSKMPEYFFDINNEGMNKGVGIEKIISYLGIKKDETICFGDGVNDYSMFEKCGIGIAMGNAKPELKNMADYVLTRTNDEDGVAKFIEENIL